jgi:tetratricopeptide (TPR) repeat protein
MIPPTGRTATGLPVQGAPAGPDPAEAARQAAAYERELRDAAHAQEAAQAAAPPSRRGRVLAVAALVLVAVAAGAAYVTVKQRAGAEAALVAVEAARAGLARDTKASLGKAAEVLAEARERAPGHPEVRSLSAQVAALLAVEHGDEAARALARSLSGPSEQHDGALAARLLLAVQPGERSAASAAVLQARPGSAPLVQRLAGRLLLEQGQVESGRGRLELAARATPPLLGALADLGDSRLRAGDAEGALPFYEAALSAHPTHPRSVIGAAEARLALGRPLDASRDQLAAVEGDPGSAPPRADRLRFELTFARVLAAGGDAMGASRRLTLAAGALGDSASLQATRATLLLGARLWEPATEAAAKAVRLEPSAEHRLLLARAQLGQHQPAAALQALAGLDSRTAWLERGIAHHQQGQHEQARAALERTVRDGRMPAEAATWYALSDVALGRAEKAVPLLEKLAEAPGASAATRAALGRAYLAAGQPGPGEAACRDAIEREARAPEGHLCLGAALLGAGKADEAVEPLETALSLDRADPLARKLLAQAKAAPPPVAAARAAPPPKAAPARAVAAKPAGAATARPAAAGAGDKPRAAAPAPPRKAPTVSTRR